MKITHSAGLRTTYASTFIKTASPITSQYMKQTSSAPLKHILYIATSTELYKALFSLVRFVRTY